MVGIGYLGFNVSGHVGSNAVAVISILRGQSEAPLTQAKDPNAQALRKYSDILKSQPDYIHNLDVGRQATIRAHDCHLCYADHKTFEAVKPLISHCLTVVPGKKNVLIIGDSKAAHLYVALMNTHTQFNFLQSTGDGCNPISGLTRDDFQWADTCKKLRDDVISFAEKHKLDAVILAGWWRAGYKDLASDIARLKAAGQRVILVGPPLEYSADVPVIIARWWGNVGFRRHMDSFIVKASIARADEMRQLRG
jgi:hypothetical protein